MNLSIQMNENKPLRIVDLLRQKYRFSQSGIEPICSDLGARTIYRNVERPGRIERYHWLGSQPLQNRMGRQMTVVDKDVLIDASRGIQEAIDCLKNVQSNFSLVASVITENEIIGSLRT